MIMWCFSDHAYLRIVPKPILQQAVVYLHFLLLRGPQKLREREVRKKGRLIEFQRPFALIFPPGNARGRRAGRPLRFLSVGPEVIIVGRGAEMYICFYEAHCSNSKGTFVSRHCSTSSHGMTEKFGQGASVQASPSYVCFSLSCGGTGEGDR